MVEMTSIVDRNRYNGDGMRSTVDNGDPLAMFLIVIVDNGEVWKKAVYYSLL